MTVFCSPFSIKSESTVKTASSTGFWRSYQVKFGWIKLDFILINCAVRMTKFKGHFPVKDESIASILSRDLIWTSTSSQNSVSRTIHFLNSILLSEWPNFTVFSTSKVSQWLRFKFVTILTSFWHPYQVKLFSFSIKVSIWNGA